MAGPGVPCREGRHWGVSARRPGFRGKRIDMALNLM